MARSPSNVNRPNNITGTTSNEVGCSVGSRNGGWIGSGSCGREIAIERPTTAFSISSGFVEERIYLWMSYLSSG